MVLGKIVIYGEAISQTSLTDRSQTPEGSQGVRFWCKRFTNARDQATYLEDYHQVAES